MSPTTALSVHSDHSLLAVTSRGMPTATTARVLAALGTFTGLVFLWAFLDKTFGLRYPTVSGRAWIRGRSPTKGFLSSVDVGGCGLDA